MRVLLLNLPWKKGSRLGVRAGSRWPFTSPAEKDGSIHYIPFPFFLSYAASLLKHGQEEAKLIDAIAEGSDEEGLINRARDFKPDLLVIETSTPSFHNDIRIINHIHGELPQSCVVLCGPHASVFPAQLLKEYPVLDYILFGEYEYTLLELVRALEGPLALGSIRGLAYRDGGKIRLNHPRPAVNDLDSFPWPEREDVPIYRYNDAVAGLPVPNVQMLSSRGCPFKCGFCLWPQTIYGERRYRPRDPVKVMDEMEYLVKHFNFKAVYFDDDTFNADKMHVLDICKQIKERRLRIPWAVMARPDLMDKEMLTQLAQAGLYAVKYGIESADAEVLRSCGKELDLARATENIRLTKKLGIKVHLTFCLGLPGETRESVKKTVGFIEDLRPDSLQLSFAVPFPGTEYFEYLKTKGWLASEDWLDYDGNYKCVVRTQDMQTEELERLASKLA